MARRSAQLSLLAMGSAVLGWLAFALAIALGDHFNSADPRSAVLLLLWLALGVVALGAWMGACVTAMRARREPGSSKQAALLAVITPCTWAFEFGLLVLWFGFEVFSGNLVAASVADVLRGV